MHSDQETGPVGIQRLKHWHGDATLEHVCPHIPVVSLKICLKSPSVFYTQAQHWQHFNGRFSGKPSLKPVTLLILCASEWTKKNIQLTITS